MSQNWLTERTLAWAGFDVASSVYVGLAPAVISPLYFNQLLAGSANPTAAWGMLAAIGILASGIAALVAASLSVRLPRLMFLKLLIAGLMLAIAALAWNPRSSLLWAALAMIAAQCFYFAATTVYESFLPDLLPQSLRQKLSGFGWGIGYVGGVVGIVALLQLTAGKPETASLLQNCYGVLGIISMMLFLVVFFLMGKTGFARLGSTAGASAHLSGVWSVVREWRHHGGVFRLLAGTMLVQTGLSVVITFTTPILASRFGQTLDDLLWLLLIIHVLSVPSTLAWNHVLTNWSRLMPMCLLLAAWAVVLVLLAFGSAPWMPVVTVSVIGCCIGATSATLRGFLAEVVPEGRSPAFFGLSTFVGRLAAALGPALFAIIAEIEGTRAALLVILAVTAAGGWLIIMHMLQERVTPPLRAYR